MTEDLLLALYDHTLEVRLWNSKEKLAPRARFDRPRAFRLPAPPTGDQQERRPERFPLVKQQTERPVSERRGRRARVRKKESNLSSVSEEEMDPDLSTSISEIYTYLHKKLKICFFLLSRSATLTDKGCDISGPDC